MSGEFKAAVIDFEYEFAPDLLYVDCGDDLPEEEFAVEDFLVLELLVADALDAAVSSDQLALALDFLAEVLDVDAVEEVARACFAVAQVDALTHAAQLREQMLPAGILPVFGVASAAVYF